MSKGIKILIVDDEQDIVELLQYNLGREGYEVMTANNGLDAISIATQFVPDFILLDVMMPSLDGIEACRRIRQNDSLKDTYIIFLTARAEEFTEIAAFEAGANDYLTKPIKPRALVSRLASLVKRELQESKDENLVQISNLIIDKTSYTVSKDNEKILLPRKEFELLFFLAQHPDKVYNRDELLRYIWGSDVFVVPRTVDVHIRKVREKIGEDYIVTVKGIGYKFSVPE